MPRLVEISAHDSRMLRDIVTVVGLEQQELKSKASVSGAWLSLVLNIKGDASKPVEAEMIERVATALVDQIKIRLSENKDEPEKELRSALDFLSRYTTAAEALVPPRIYTAGGPIPVDADHYIQRPSDQYLMSGLQAPAFTTIVQGPVQCGKSSLLAQLEHKARAKGFETAWFDPWATLAPVLGPGKEPSEIIALAAMRLTKNLEIEWRLDPPRNGAIEYIEHVSGWLLNALASADRKPRLLIVDDLASLGARVADEWKSFIRTIDTKRASRNIPISIAVGMTHHFGPYFVRRLEDWSSIVSWSPLIELNWLDQAQTEDLERKLTNKNLNLYPLFRGQPYLTHAAAMDADFRESVEQWTHDETEKSQRPVVGSLPYRQHLKAIRLMFGPPWQDEPGPRRLLGIFVEVCRSQSTKAFETLQPDDQEFLKTAKLVDENGEPALKIYRLIAEDLSERMGV